MGINKNKFEHQHFFVKCLKHNIVVFLSFLHKLFVVEIKRSSFNEEISYLWFSFLLNNEAVYVNNAIHNNTQFVQYQPINNEDYHDSTVRFISPFVYEAINSHYQSEDSLTQNLNTAPSLIRIEKVERVGNIDNFEFLITVVATGFVGKNTPVVDGQITFRVNGPMSGSGENSVYFEGFKQLKTYELPQKWKHIIKKPLE